MTRTEWVVGDLRTIAVSGSKVKSVGEINLPEGGQTVIADIQGGAQIAIQGKNILFSAPEGLEVVSASDSKLTVTSHGALLKDIESTDHLIIRHRGRQTGVVVIF